MLGRNGSRPVVRILTTQWYKLVDSMDILGADVVVDYSGEEFKTAFSCFIFSEVEPKGVDCIEKFKYVDSKTMALNRLY